MDVDMKRRVHRAALRGTTGLLAVVLGGCHSERDLRITIQEVDSAGVRIVSLPAMSMIAEEFTIGSQPVYRTGWASGGRAFEDVVSGGLWSDGRAVVGDAGGSMELVFLSKSGRVDAVVGGRGQGPGELGSIFGLVPLGRDTVMVQDYVNGRVSLFDSAGSLGEIPLESRRFPRLLGRDARDRLLLGPPLRFVYPDPVADAREQWLKAPLLRVDGDTGDADTVAWTDWSASFSPGSSEPALAGGFATVAQGRYVVGRGDRPEVRWLGEQGAVQQIARWDAEPRAITDTMMAAGELGIRGALERYGLTSSEIDSRVPDMEIVGETLPLFGLPAPEPQYGGLVSDLEGNVWIASYVLPYVRSPRRYYVLSPQGEWLGWVEVPIGLRVLAIGNGEILGVERDEYDVQAVALYRFTRRTSSS